MGFLDWVFNKKEKDYIRNDAEEAKILLKDVETFVSNKIKKDFESLKEPIKEKYASLNLVSNIMKNQLKVLEEATYPEGTYTVLINKAVGNRKSFLEKMSFLIKQIQRPIGNDVKSILTFYEEIDKLINITNIETTKEYAFLKILFEKEGKEVVQSFRQIIEINNKISDILRGLKESNLKLLKINEVVLEVSKLSEELKKNEVYELDKKSKEDEDRIKEIENELEKLHYSDDWKAFLEMNRVKEELKLRIENKRSDFVNKISKLEVPLKKYKWLFEKGILNLYIEKSLESILREDPKSEAFMSAVKDMKIKIIEGKMELKDSKKFMSFIEDIIENNTIGKVIEDYKSLSQELKNQEEKISSQEVSKRKIKLESEMKGLKKEIEDIKEDKKRAEERFKRIQANKEQKIKELEELLYYIFGKKVLLVVN
jgi:hypothetical protein